MGRAVDTQPIPRIKGLAVAASDYPPGQAGPDKTTDKIIGFILDGRSNPLARQFAEGIIRLAGVAPNAQLSNRQAMQLLLNYVRKEVRYRPDAAYTETVQNPKITLCVPGAAACIPVGDCDDGTAVLGWLLTGYGIPVRLIVQHFGSDTDHVLLEGQDESGKWLAMDFSQFNYENNPVGWKPVAKSEYVIDPFSQENLKLSGARDIEFVAVGRLPDRQHRRGDLPVVTLGRLPPREVRLGAVTFPFMQATADLDAQVQGPIMAGDTYMAASPPEYDAALSAYQAAGQAGATNVGPEIDAAGQMPFTGPLTQKAWQLNGKLAALSGNSIDVARQAQSLAKQIAALYAQAIDVGSNPPARGGVAGTGVPPIVAILVTGIVGGLGYAYFEGKNKKRR